MSIPGISNPITPEEREVVALHSEMQKDIDLCKSSEKVIVVIKSPKANEREVSIERYSTEWRIVAIIYYLWGWCTGTVFSGTEAKKVLLQDLESRAAQLALKVQRLRINERIDFNDYASSIAKIWNESLEEIRRFYPASREESPTDPIARVNKLREETLKWMNNHRITQQQDLRKLMGDIRNPEFSSKERMDKSLVILRNLHPSTFEKAFIDLHQIQVFQAIDQAMGEQEAKEFSDLRTLYNQNQPMIEKLGKIRIDENNEDVKKLYAAILAKQNQIKDKMIDYALKKMSEADEGLKQISNQFVTAMVEIEKSSKALEGEEAKALAENYRKRTQELRESYSKHYTDMNTLVEDVSQDEFINTDPRVIQKYAEFQRTLKESAQMMADRAISRLEGKGKMILEDIQNAREDSEEYVNQGRGVTAAIEKQTKELQSDLERIQKEEGIPAKARVSSDPLANLNSLISYTRDGLNAKKAELKMQLDAQSKQLEALKRQVAEKEAKRGDERVTQEQFHKIVDALESAYNKKIENLAKTASQKRGEDARRLSVEMAEAGKNAEACRDIKRRGITAAAELTDLIQAIPEVHSVPFTELWNHFVARLGRMEREREKIIRLEDSLKRMRGKMEQYEKASDLIEIQKKHEELQQLYQRSFAHQTGIKDANAREKDLEENLHFIQQHIEALLQASTDPEELFALLDAAESLLR